MKKTTINDVTTIGEDVFFYTSNNENYFIPNGNELFNKWLHNNKYLEYVEEGDSSWFERPDNESDLMDQFVLDHPELWIESGGE